jgi:WD40 repeat protein
VAFSRDGRLLAAAGFDRVIRVLGAESGRERGRLSGRGVGVYSLAFYPSANRLASAGGDASVKLWDLREFLQGLSLRQHDHEVYGVAFSPDGQLLASSGFDGAIRVRGLTSASQPETGAWPRDRQGSSFQESLADTSLCLIAPLPFPLPFAYAPPSKLVPRADSPCWLRSSPMVSWSSVTRSGMIMSVSL